MQVSTDYWKAWVATAERLSIETRKLTTSLHKIVIAAVIHEDSVASIVGLEQACVTVRARWR